MQLHHRTFGDPANFPVVLLHGLFGSSANWGGIARRLQEHRHVLVPDLRNHGRSSHAATHDYPSMAADVIGLLDREGIDTAALVGHSMGGKVAMHLALSRPQRVAALAVVDMAPARYTHDFANVLAAFRQIDLATVSSRADADAQMRASISGSAVRAFLLQNLELRDGRWAWRVNLSALAAAQAAITGFPDYPPGTRYTGPTLFVHGALSDYVKPSHHVAIRQLFPQASLRSIEGAGHWVYADQAAAFIEAIEGFLELAS